MEQLFDQFCRHFVRLHDEGRELVVVTMTDSRGGAPQDEGARMMVGPEGLIFGTIGGGKIEQRCLEVARELLQNPAAPKAQTQVWNLQRDIGMSCGGEVSMFFEVFRPSRRWHVAIFGAGHVAQELVPLLLKLDCYLSVIDPRADWLEKLPQSSARFKKICRDDMQSVLASLAPDTFVGMMTMGHSFDAPILKRALLEFDFPYIGVIGSAQKRRRLESELQEAGVAAQRCKSFFCPMGEDFGGNAPAEIAISMLAQLLRERDRFFARSSG